MTELGVGSETTFCWRKIGYSAIVIKLLHPIWEILNCLCRVGQTEQYNMKPKSQTWCPTLCHLAASIVPNQPDTNDMFCASVEYMGNCQIQDMDIRRTEQELLLTEAIFCHPKSDSRCLAWCSVKTCKIYREILIWEIWPKSFKTL